MFTQTNSAIQVNTAQCQSGVVSAKRTSPRVEEPEVVSSVTVRYPANPPTVSLEENTIYLNRTESTFINKEVRRLLKAQLAEVQRKKKAHIPLPPAPGKIAYAVYQ